MSVRLEVMAADYGARVRADLAGAPGAAPAELRGLADQRLRELVAADRVPLNVADIDRLIGMVIDDTLGYGPLDGLLSDPAAPR